MNVLALFLKGLGTMLGGGVGLLLEAVLSVLGGVLFQKVMARRAALLIVGSALSALARLTPTPEDDRLIAQALAEYRAKLEAGGDA